MDELPDLRFSAHMIQHMPLNMIAAPLILRGPSSPMMRGALGNRNAREVFGRVSDPLVRHLAFNWYDPELEQA